MTSSVHFAASAPPSPLVSTTQLSPRYQASQCIFLWRPICLRSLRIFDAHLCPYSSLAKDRHTNAFAFVFEFRSEVIDEFCGMRV